MFRRAEIRDQIVFALNFWRHAVIIQVEPDAPWTSVDVYRAIIESEPKPEVTGKWRVGVKMLQIAVNDMRWLGRRQENGRSIPNCLPRYVIRSEADKKLFASCCAPISITAVRSRRYRRPQLDQKFDGSSANTQITHPARFFTSRIACRNVVREPATILKSGPSSRPPGP